MRAIICSVLILSSGYGAGRIFGEALLKHFFSGDALIFYFISNPAGDILEVFRKLHHDDDLVRMSGYYGLVDYDIIDPEFIFERFRAEKKYFIKRTLIWVLGRSKDTAVSLKFLEKIVNISKGTLKSDAIKCIRNIRDEKGVYPK